MKKLILLLLFTSFAFAQNEVKPLKLKGSIEIDGHIFNNETTKNPIWFKADLDDIYIYDDKNNKYIRRVCNLINCKITHLVLKYTLSTNGVNYINPSFLLAN